MKRIDRPPLFESWRGWYLLLLLVLIFLILIFSWIKYFFS